MANLTAYGKVRGALRAPLALLPLALLALALLGGCVANDENAMPWAAPDPNESSINLPGSYARP
ncbi:MAG: hypothetical protein IJP66_06925 [Kiritimatiellae bacterium]|nr:hypothetical protein [Kiritimatiellia bacterium]